MHSLLVLGVVALLVVLVLLRQRAVRRARIQEQQRAQLTWQQARRKEERARADAHHEREWRKAIRWTEEQARAERRKARAARRRERMGRES